MSRWMLFVDGENLSIEGEKVARDRNKNLVKGGQFRPGVYLWPTGATATTRRISVYQLRIEPDAQAIRAFYYTTMSGTDEERISASEALWQMGFTPRIFPKRKGHKSKGVDIALATDMLSNAFLDNYDIALLVAGDGDYKPLVDEVKRLGKIVYLWWFKDHALSAALRVTCDWHEDFTPMIDSFPNL